MTVSRGNNLKGYLFILPALLSIGVVFAYPLFQNLYFSLLDLAQAGRPFSGMRNYVLMAADPLFWTSLRNNALLILLVPVLVVVALVFAVVLFERVRGWRFYRGVMLIPYITSITAVGLFFTLFFQGRGILNTLLRSLGLESLVVDWLGSTRWALPAIMVVIVWREFGFGAMLFLARLATVPEELFEAARLDGAGWLRRLRNVVVPQLATVIEFYVFIMIVTMLSWVFNYIYVMTLGGPARSTFVTELYIYIMAFRMQKMGVASGVSIILLLITAALAFISLRFRSRLLAEYE